MDRVMIFDTTLRDGEQTPGVALTVDEKLEVAQQLAALGVDVIEAGFPINSKPEFEAVRNIADNVKGSTITALARTVQKDIEVAADAIKNAEHPRIHVFMSTSDIHLQHMMRISREEAAELAKESVKYARSLCAEVEFSPQDATRTDRDYLVEIVNLAIDAGATIINLPDTVGYATPWTYAEMFQYVMERTPKADQVIWSCHTHDDLGLAVANALAAVRVGVRQVECAVNGIGERAGNCSLEEVVMALNVRNDVFGLTTNVKPQLLGPTSELVARVTGITPPPNKAVIGAHAFAHESGIHQDGVIKEPSTYEIMRPEAVGMDKTKIVLGKHSGRHAVKLRLQELGFIFDDEQFKEVFRRFKTALEEQRVIDDEALAEIARDVRAASIA